MSDTPAEDGLTPGPIFRILGPLDLDTRDAVEVTVPPGRHQVVLGALLVEANRVVRVDQLIDAVWYDDPPATARTQVQICVSGLRQSLAPFGESVAIVTRSPGYLLRVARDQVDAHLFARLVAESETLTRDGRAEEAAALIRRALGLWRGPALSGTPSRVLQAKGAQLDERRLSAIEACADLELQLGRHRRVIDEFGPLVAEHPLRERLRGQLMLALYRAGRQADALRVYRDGRQVLVDQLGLEPGEELRRLERAILAGDPALQRGPQPPALEPVHVPEPPPRETAPPPAMPLPTPAVPHLLPADLPDFTGRDEVIEAVGQALDRVPVVILTGKPGVGKTALAVRLAHRIADARYPDGCLYADLGGTRTEPVPAADVLGRFLRALGLPGEAIPDDAQARADTYRALLAGRRMVVVLDDAATDAQAAALLPAAPGCGVLVTTRTRLTELPGAAVVEVDVMDAAQSLRMLAAVIGAARVEAEPAAADALIRLVGGLPLALRVVAARLAARPHWSLAWMRERLADERRRLDELSHGQLMVRASLALSYDGLEPGARRLLRVLSGLEAVTFPVWVGAALLDVDLFEASDLLELLVDVQLLEIAAVDLNGTPRYKFHEIIRLFARERLESDETDGQRHDDLLRVGAGWLAMAREAHRRIYGGDYTILLGAAAARLPAQSYVTQVLADPLRWLEAERANLCAVVGQAAEAGADELAWSLAIALVALFEARCYYDDWERTHRQALAATTAAGNRRGVAALRCSLGSLHLSRSRLDDAEREIAPALAEFLDLGDAGGAALARRNLALLHQMRGDHATAAARYHEALDGFRAVDDPIGQAHVLSQLARLELAAGGEAATGYLHRALDLCRGVGNRRVEAQVRFRLSELMLSRGRYREAEDLLTDVLDLVRAAGDLVGNGRILHQLGVVKARLGGVAQARRLLDEALAVHVQLLDQRGAEAIRAELARLGTSEDAEDTEAAAAASVGLPAAEGGWAAIRP